MMRVKKIIGIIERAILIMTVGLIIKPSFYIECIPDVFKSIWLEARE